MSAPQRDRKQPVKCLSQRLRLGRGENHSQDISTASLKVLGLCCDTHNPNKVLL